jgi:hypothetical protein
LFVGEIEIHGRLPFTCRHFGAREASNYDVQLHIGESRCEKPPDSGFAASRAPK